jgi:hypothetical protein
MKNESRQFRLVTLWRYVVCVAAAFCALPALGAVLPEDRVDLMFHNYEGGDVTVDGPSLLLRKKIGEQVSISGNYYLDLVTSASIDVKTLGASEYKEEREQMSLAVDYLRGKTTYNMAYIESEESDYIAKTATVGISEDMFGDLTTVSIGYTRAWDQVFRNVKQADGSLINDPIYGGDKAFRRSNHRSYRLGISQVITKSLLMGLNFEAQTHEGQLGNPYRAIRFFNLTGTQVLNAEERIPGTRTNNAASLTAKYYLPFRAAVNGSYRFFTDTWGVNANTWEVGYVQPWRAWTFEVSYRNHSQEAADFYGDLFPRPEFQNFMARDRNLATMTNQTLHLGVTFDLVKLEQWTRSWLNKGTISLFFDHVQFDFEDFRDGTQSSARYSQNPVAEGTEGMYSEQADVVRFFISIWF